jgi:hypothetical protein
LASVPDNKTTPIPVGLWLVHHIPKTLPSAEARTWTRFRYQLHMIAAADVLSSPAIGLMVSVLRSVKEVRSSSAVPAAE